MTWKEMLPTHTEYMPMLPEERPSRTNTQVRGALRVLTPIAIFILGLLLGSRYPNNRPLHSDHPTSLLPLSLSPLPQSPIPPVTSLPPPLDPIPNIVHYVYGLKDGPAADDFPYYAYLGMRSAMTTLKPEKILFHCLNEPRGYWWDRVLNWEGWQDETGKRRGMVEVVKARDVQYIGKDRRPVIHYAHKADIIRLEVLLEHGGIYLDIDTFILRPFAPASIMEYDMVMGMEASVSTAGTIEEIEPKGLCNAIMAARPGAVFIERWLQSYDSFDDVQWADHSVIMPWTLAKLYPTTITVLSARTLFWPLWSRDHIAAVYKSNDWDFEASGQLAYHAWESIAKSHLNALDPTTVQSTNTSFTRMARRFQEPDEERRWKAWRELDRALL